MPTPEDIADLHQLLATCRRTLSIYLRQQIENGGPAQAPVGVINGIIATRAQIQHIKLSLRSWGEVVEDHPNDEEIQLQQNKEERQQEDNSDIRRASELAELIELNRLHLYHLGRKEALLGIMADRSIAIEKELTMATLERLLREQAQSPPARLAERFRRARLGPTGRRATHAQNQRIIRRARKPRKHEDPMKKILLLDNNADFLNTVADSLEIAGYEVYRADSIERARQLLDYIWVHVAVVDLRLHNDKDPKDESGLVFAKDPLYRSIPKIVFTRYPTVAAVREALGPSLEGLPPAVDFIDKRDRNPRALPDAIERIFEQHARINTQLTIDWTQPIRFPALVNYIQPEHDNTRLLDRCAELEDLLRKLFHEFKQITIGRVLKHDAGRIMLEVFAYSAAGAERQYVVSCGRKADIAAEDRRYKDVVPQAIGNHSTIRSIEADTLRFAATAYVLSGGDLEEIVPFRDYYQSKPLEAVADCLRMLYHDTLAPWYRKGRKQLHGQPLRDLLIAALNLRPGQLAPEALGQRAEAICQKLLESGLVRGVEIDSTSIALRFHDDVSISYPHPGAAYQDRYLRGDLPVLYGVIHGRIDADSILADHTGQSWLIDFTQAGWGPLLQDFVRLEATIKFDLLDTLDLAARYALERRLLATQSLTDALADEMLAPELQRALVAIEQIRRSAAALAGSQLAAYEIGLFLGALGYIATYDPELHYPRRRLAPYAHALFLAAMLADRLLAQPDSTPADLPAQARTSLWIDDQNQVAWVEGRRIELTAQEYQILAFLAEQAGTLRTRQQIADHVLESNYDETEESRLNSAVSRLRLKIEPDPKHPKYLQTVRGRGYRLILPDGG
jgi:DNA-binding response OmpR family regulator